jgi:hypothetical protein
VAGAGDATGIGDAAGCVDTSVIGAGAGIGAGDGTALAWGIWPGRLLATGVGSSTGLTIVVAGVDVTVVASTSGWVRGPTNRRGGGIFETLGTDALAGIASAANRRGGGILGRPELDETG